MVDFDPRKWSFSRHANGRFHVTQMVAFTSRKRATFARRCATSRGFCNRRSFAGRATHGDATDLPLRSRTAGRSQQPTTPFGSHTQPRGTLTHLSRKRAPACSQEIKPRRGEISFYSKTKFLCGVILFFANRPARACVAHAPKRRVTECESQKAWSAVVSDWPCATAMGILLHRRDRLFLSPPNCPLCKNPFIVAQNRSVRVTQKRRACVT